MADEEPQIGLSDSFFELTALETPPIQRLKVPMIRPPSYSDSFLVLSSPHKVQSKPLDIPISAIRPRFDIVWWYEKLISLCIHISLIALFETVFFFQFISKSEDSGILKTIDKYVYDLADSCVFWPANITIPVNELLLLFINPMNVSEIANDAALSRANFNKNLQIQAWLYFISLTAFTGILSAIAVWKRLKFHWKRVFIENIAMVALLGIYEFAFFRTIIYNYISLSVPEIDEHIVNILHSMCRFF
jgi:hypothetical protein